MSDKCGQIAEWPGLTGVLLTYLRYMSFIDTSMRCQISKDNILTNCLVGSCAGTKFAEDEIFDSVN